MVKSLSCVWIRGIKPSFKCFKKKIRPFNIFLKQIAIKRILETNRGGSVDQIVEIID